MIGKLLKFIGSIPSKLLKKSSIEDEIDVLYSNIRLGLLPIIDSVKAKMVQKEDIKLSTIPFLKDSDVDKNYKNASTLIGVINNVINQLDKKRKDIEFLLKDVPTTMSTKAMTTNQLLLLNIIDNIKLFTEMSADIGLLLAEKYNDSESVYSSPVLAEKKALLYDYYNILSTYVNMDKTVVDLGNIVITNTQAVATILADTKIDIPDRLEETKGFTGNPIYHAGLFYQDLKKELLKFTIKKKEYAELLLASYELKKVGQYDPTLDTLIENAKDVINEYELKIEKLRRG